MIRYFYKQAYGKLVAVKATSKDPAQMRAEGWIECTESEYHQHSQRIKACDDLHGLIQQRLNQRQLGG